MPGPATDISTLRFSTEELPERDRLPMSLEVYGRAVVKLMIEPAGDVPLRAHFAARVLAGLTVASFDISPVRAQRTSELLADGNDDVVLCVSPTGGNGVTHLARELTTTAGGAVLFSNSDTCSFDVVSTSRAIHIGLPRKDLGALVCDLEGMFMRQVPKEAEPLRLLKSYISMLEENQTLATPELRHLVVTHVYDLVAMALGPTRDASEIAKGRGVRVARLHTIKYDIIRNIDTADLSVIDIAARHRVTPRCVQILFEDEGTTFSQFLLEQRLARVHRLLRAPRSGRLSISAIAFQSGLGDLSHFNRAFRRRYGEAPSDVRAAARGEREM